MPKEPEYRGDGLLRNLLASNAEEFGERVMVRFENGESWTARDAFAQACRAANVLKDLGLRQGDVVGVMMTNGPEFLRAWWGAQCLGLVMAPLNPALKGSLLAHATTLGAPKLIVVEHG